MHAAQIDNRRSVLHRTCTLTRMPHTLVCIIYSTVLKSQLEQSSQKLDSVHIKYIYFLVAITDISVILRMSSDRLGLLLDKGSAI